MNKLIDSIGQVDIGELIFKKRDYGFVVEYRSPDLGGFQTYESWAQHKERSIFTTGYLLNNSKVTTIVVDEMPAHIRENIESILEFIE